VKVKVFATSSIHCFGHYPGLEFCRQKLVSASRNWFLPCHGLSKQFRPKFKPPSAETINVKKTFFILVMFFLRFEGVFLIF